MHWLHYRPTLVYISKQKGERKLYQGVTGFILMLPAVEVGRGKA